MKYVLIALGLFFSSYLYGQKLNGTFISKFDRYYSGYKVGDNRLQSESETAWKGERVYYQILLWADSDINNLTYEFSNFESEYGFIELSKENIRIGKFVKGDIEPRSCAEYSNHNEYVYQADALSTNLPLKLEVGDTISFFFLIDVPENTSEGIYNGSFEVKSEGSSIEFQLQLEVQDMLLPHPTEWEFHLDLWQFPDNILSFYNEIPSNEIIDHWSSEHFDLIRPAYEMLTDVGQKVITAHIKKDALGSPSMIEWIMTQDSNWIYDFTAFDRYVEEMMMLGISKQISCFSPVGWNESEIPYWDEATNEEKILNAPLGSNVYNTRWDHFLTDFKIHLEDKGWFNITVLYLDEVSEKKLNDVITVVKENDQNWKLGIAYSHGLTDSTKSHFYDLSGIIEDASNSGIDGDKISTFYTSCTQTAPNNYVTPQTSLAEMTWMAYYSAHKDFDGYLRWAYDYWRNRSPFDIRDGSNTAGDFAFIYRNSNVAPIEYYSSLRLELLREGIEDFEKMRILRQKYENADDSNSTIGLNAIDEVLKWFDLNSGRNAKKTVERGQNAIKKITIENFNVSVKKK